MLKIVKLNDQYFYALQAIVEKLILGVLLFCSILSSVLGQDDSRGVGNKKIQTEKRVALIIGNGTYQKVPQLANPVNDARDMSTALKNIGFDVIIGENITADEMKRKIKQFGAALAQTKGIGLFFYAGHGVQVNGKNYMIPVDADNLREQTIEFDAVDINRVLAEMDAAGSPLNIVILDACRNNPFERSWRSADQGLAQISAPKGTLIAYATAPGKVASDGSGRNGLYTSELLKQLNTPNVLVETVFKRVGEQVSEVSNGQQEPYLSLSVRGDFYFVRSGTKPVNATITAGTLSKSKLPTGGEMRFSYIPAGEFQMGGKVQLGEPVHNVRISKDFWMGQTEVTQAQWQAVMGSNPSKNVGCPECPVERVSWDDAWQFINRLNEANDGFKYRLPTEAEWEYAARSGTTGAYAGDLDSMAWYGSTNFTQKPQQVGRKSPNGWGLYDMHGNVLEWVQDWFGSYSAASVTDPTGPRTGSNRVVRGGAFDATAPYVQSSFRNGYPQSLRNYDVGFRVVRIN